MIEKRIVFVATMIHSHQRLNLYGEEKIQGWKKWSPVRFDAYLQP